VVSDIQALGALRAARDMGLRIPEDLAIIGFDDIQLSAYVGLSTMMQPMYDIGRQAIQQLLRRIEEPALAPSHTVFAPRLIHRQTCGRACPVSRQVFKAQGGLL